MPSRVIQFTIHFGVDRKVKRCLAICLGLGLFVGYLFSRNSVILKIECIISYKLPKSKWDCFTLWFVLPFTVYMQNQFFAIIEPIIGPNHNFFLISSFLLNILTIIAKLCFVIVKTCSNCNFTSNFHYSHDICII